ncbi:alpha/beta hydrolase [Parvularcula sp. ZS-1/3]|uniref:Alpha/beta hydrolase n=1 Tax=Parvularcula mediterranea TaxID=2732508 RepID=A0A7Y3RP66_9PROT|nr:alpha/beta hydrolase [Parvularcula mediterranea]NNU17689.1 alpha/beta hydrolase [Parvularcula mediterranea]
MRQFRSGALLASAFLFAACSGGGGSDEPEPLRGGNNIAPTVTSADIVNVDENVAGGFYQASATDPEGDTPFSWAVSDQGTDSSFFEITGDGELSFIDAPDFESPRDENADNEYLVELEVRDALGAIRFFSLRVRVQNIDDGDPVRYVDEVFTDTFVTRNVQYGEGKRGSSSVPLFMDVFGPSGDAEVLRPTMILVHGGGFTGGNRQELEEAAESFARRGYTAVTVDYRLLERAPQTEDELTIGAIEAFHDVLAAVRFLQQDFITQEIYGVDGEKVFVFGVSAGAVVAATMATFEDDETFPSQAGRDYLAANGGYEGETNDLGGSVSSEIQGVISLSGAILDADWIDADSKPIYIAHDEFDPIVPCGTSAEGAHNTGLVVVGGCSMIEGYDMRNSTENFRTLIKIGNVGHVSFNAAEFDRIISESGQLFLDRVIEPAP